MQVRTAAALGLIVAICALPADAQPPHRFMGGPVTLEDQGSFFVGGVTKITEYASTPNAPPGQPTPGPTPQQITIGQMYVQFEIPARRSGSGWPVIMVHGSTHTGAALESTPDGREGWYPYFVRHGIPTYVVDQSDSTTLILSPPPCDQSKGQVAASAALSDTVLYRRMIDAWSMRNLQYSGQNGHDQFFDTFVKFGAITWGQTGPMLAEAVSRAGRGHVLYLELMLSTDEGKATQIGLGVGWNGDFKQTLDKLKANGIPEET